VLDDASNRPMSPLIAALWTIALWLLGNVCVALTEAARPGALSDIVSLGTCEVLATSLVAFAMVRVHARDASLRATFGLRPLSLLHVALSVAAGAGLCPVLSTLDDVIVKRWPYNDPEALESMQKLLSASSRLALVVGVFVVIPLARELFFRGILFGELRRATSSVVAGVATAAFFAASSFGGWRTMPMAFVLGLALARVRAQSGSVIAAIALHWAFWSVEGIPILLGRDPAADVTYPTRWIAGGAVIAALSLAVIGSGKRGDAAA
jgi:membrane protease YdiL (CAAX protease family)